MRRALPLFFLLAVLLACRLPPDQRPLSPLPEDGQVFTYDELFSRARTQTAQALEAFYIDNWKDLVEVAQGLEQTARFLPKTSDQPVALKSTLVAESAQLGKEANRLRLAAETKNVGGSNESLQQIHLLLKNLRPGKGP